MSAQTSIWRIALYEELQAIEEKATADKDTDMERGVCSISNVFVHLPHRTSETVLCHLMSDP